MVRINTELMLRRRIQLGWTSEELAEKSGLDARTIRRLEQGKTRPRLHTAVAVARALTLDTSTFVLDDKSLAGERNAILDEALAAAEGMAAAFKGTGYAFWPDADEQIPEAFKATGYTFPKELTCEGEQGAKEVMHVVSHLLTRALAMEGKGPAKQEGDGVYGVAAAFKAADVAIRTTLSSGGALAFDEVTRVLSLLLARYARASRPRPGNDVLADIRMIDAVAEQARAALSDFRTPGYHLRATTGESSKLFFDEKGNIRIGDVILRKSSG